MDKSPILFVLITGMGLRDMSVSKDGTVAGNSKYSTNDESGNPVVHAKANIFPRRCHWES